MSLSNTKPNLTAAPASTLALFEISGYSWRSCQHLSRLSQWLPHCHYHRQPPPLALADLFAGLCNIFLMSWKPDLLVMFFLPFLGFFEMLLFFLSSWILGKRTFPNHLRMRPLQRQNISRRLRLRQPMRMFLAQGHCGRS